MQVMLTTKIDQMYEAIEANELYLLPEILRYLAGPYNWISSSSIEMYKAFVDTYAFESQSQRYLH